MTNFYHNKLCAIIGGAGFIGQHLVRQLLERGASVRVLDNLSRGICEVILFDKPKDRFATTRRTRPKCLRKTCSRR
jgi:nucleoside-diphosphate-sugar epimerase